MVLALIGLVIAVGLSRSGSESEGSQEPTAPAETAPPAETTPAPPPPTETAPEQGASLRRREVDGRYAIGLPRGWDGDNDGGILSLTPPGRVAEIRIFYETGGASDIKLAEGARGFLADEHDGAQVGRPQRIRVGSIRGFEVTATYGGGQEVAIVLTRGGYSFLVLRRVDRGASEAIAAQADASFKSFRAKR